MACKRSAVRPRYSPQKSSFQMAFFVGVKDLTTDNTGVLHRVKEYFELSSFFSVKTLVFSLWLIIK